MGISGYDTCAMSVMHRSSLYKRVNRVQVSVVNGIIGAVLLPILD